MNCFVPIFPRALHYFLFHSATLVRHFAQSFLETHRNHSWGSIAFPVMSDDVSQILLLFQNGILFAFLCLSQLMLTVLHGWRSQRQCCGGRWVLHPSLLPA